MDNPNLPRLMKSLSEYQLDGLVLNPGPSLYYLTGLNFHVMERPVLLFIIPGKKPSIVLPSLEMAKLDSAKFELNPFPYDDNPSTWLGVISNAVKSFESVKNRIGVEPTHLRFLELAYLEQALPGSQFVSASEILAHLRIQKNPDEILLIQKAVKIAENALLATIPFIHMGITEKEIASELTLQLIRSGSDPDLAFNPIVSSGPNSANPHAEPSDRVLQSGDLLVIDWGARYKGYISDLTRTFGIGKIQPELENMVNLVLESNRAGCSVAQPGIEAGVIDKTARAIIEGGCFGPNFTHRTGHGIGLEAHEPPYIFGENSLILREGMCFTIEPGIYLAGQNGARIEDNIVITISGAKILSSLPRELQIIE